MSRGASTDRASAGFDWRAAAAAFEARLVRAAVDTRGWGWPGAVGVALLLVALLLAAGATPAVERDALAAQERASGFRQQAARESRRVATTQPQASGAEAFRDGFPSASVRARRVAELLALAQRHGLTVRRSEFRHQPEPALGLARYRITLPAEGDYSALRAFALDSLDRDPALALDGLRIVRAEGGTGRLRAELRYTLFTRLDPDNADGGPR